MIGKSYKEVFDELDSKIKSKKDYKELNFNLNLKNEENSSLISANELGINTGFTIVTGLLVIDIIEVFFEKGFDKVSEVDFIKLCPLAISLAIMVSVFFIINHNNKKHKEIERKIKQELLVLELDRPLLYDAKP